MVKMSGGWPAPRRHPWSPLLLAAIILILSLPGHSAERPVILNRTAAIGPAELAIIVNERDPLSQNIAAYYQKRRGIPEQNIIRIAFKPGNAVMSETEFARLKATVDAKTPPSVQAYALTWMVPYRVGCMSITTAFAAGFDPAYCATGCKLTKRSPYFNSDSKRPFQELGLRPTMSIAAVNFDFAKALIDRGVASDASFPKGTAYLLQTSDRNRTVRVNNVDQPRSEQLTEQVRLEILKQDFIRNKRDVLFYFTGLAKVPVYNTNRYLPGAIADHLTSAGGVLSGSGQMSALRWLEAGATGSYGTVVEPCNFPTKFPVPEIVIGRYLKGESLIESYWKSVAMPGQGIFIGEPLAKPFGGFRTTLQGNRLTIYSPNLPSGSYRLYGATSPKGPFSLAASGETLLPSPHQLQFTVARRYPFYLLKRITR